MQEKIKKMSEEAGVDEVALRALFIAAIEYFRGCKLAEDQREEILNGKVLEWLERADTDDDPTLR